MFPRDRVRASLTKYNIPFDESLSDDELRDLLAGFYAERTLTRQPSIRPTARKPFSFWPAAYPLHNRPLDSRRRRPCRGDSALDLNVNLPASMQEPARIAIDLGAESCRVSLLRWVGGVPSIEVIHRVPNGPVRRGAALHWPLDTILAGLEEGLRKAAQAALEGIASIAVDSWGVDYVRLAPDGSRSVSPSATGMSAP